MNGHGPSAYSHAGSALAPETVYTNRSEPVKYQEGTCHKRHAKPQN
jgi:hypothetical protein